MPLRALPGLQDCNEVVSALLQLEKQAEGPYLVLRRRDRGRVRCSIRLDSRSEEGLVHALSTLKAPAAGEFAFLLSVEPDADFGC